MDVFQLRQFVIDEYCRYISSFFTIRESRIAAKVQEEFSAQRLWPAPLVQLNPSFQPAQKTIDEMIESGLLDPRCRDIFRAKRKDHPPGPVFHFHRHQEQAIAAASQGHNYVLTTGTGSGKSLSYIVPIVDHVLRAGSGQGVKALIIYPMNALANSQEGELAKFLELGFSRPPVTFAAYTGQERDQKARQRIIDHPPDILLTNYVMLEYILTRPQERTLVRTMHQLRFLVLDELHTYRGRQGADVALLLRRLRQASRASNLQYVGTSATLAGGGSWSEQQNEVAGIAGMLFGASVKPEHVIGETLETRSTRSETIEALTQTLRDNLEVPFPTTLSLYQQHALVRWIELQLGLQEEDGYRRRREPRPIDGPDGIAHVLADQLNISLEKAADWLFRALKHQVDGKPFFAFRLHQFLAKGETVYASPLPAETRELSLDAQRFVPGSNRKRGLFPLAFCRECGQEYYTVHRVSYEDTLMRFEPRTLQDNAHSEVTDRQERQPGFLLIDPERKLWPEDPVQQQERLPANWLEETNTGTRVRASRNHYLPISARIDACGKAEPEGLEVLWFPRPFRYCFQCQVAFSNRGSDYSRLATLGSEGRSTATTIASRAVLAFLDRLDGETLTPKARKLLSFTDNRQDASLQAGHFNDFLQVLQLRRGLYKAVSAASPGGLDYQELSESVFSALELPFEAYAQDADVKYGREDVDACFRDVLSYLLFRDLQRGWRINAPNLEQCGLLQFRFKNLEALCHDDPEWAACPTPLAEATGQERLRVCLALLDHLRRELVIDALALDPTFQGRIPRAVQQLTPAWSVEDMENLLTAKTAFPGSKPKKKKGRQRRDRIYLSERGSLGRYLRRPNTFANQQPGSLEETREVIQALCERLKSASILREVQAAGKDTPAGYRINPAQMKWMPGDGTRRFEDVMRLASDMAELLPNAYFVALYRDEADDPSHLLAAEHTAQVPAEVRKQREEDFRHARLPLMFCSPTMELGVDIKDLSVVNMRNVPPTPANYAQRSGRAGRSGQAAFVFTYCTSGSPHDTYFFKRPGQMVSGQVKPPRLDLCNEDLVRAHVHAIWFQAADLELPATPKDLLDLSGELTRLKLLPEVEVALANPHFKRLAYRAAIDSLRSEIEAFVFTQNRNKTAQTWLMEVLDRLPASFEAACVRWYELFKAASEQYEYYSKLSVDDSRGQSDVKRARGLRADAQLRLDILKGTMERQNSDFYTYRYFASEGFLPGYNFPRLPITAFLRGQRSHGREAGDALSRPRFLAIAEFGPRAIIYHEGSRYMINRVDMPVGLDEEPTSRAWQCAECGYMHPEVDQKGVDTCDYCASDQLTPYQDLFRMAAVGTRRRDRINSDEEERTRLGYKLKVGVRFPMRDGRRSSRKGTFLVGEEEVAHLEYGAAATITRLSLGWRHSKDKHVGFMLDLERGFWARNKDDGEDQEPEDELSTRVKRVIPFVEDTRNTLLLTFPETLPLETMATLQAALKHALQVHYQVEDRELACEAMPSNSDRRVLLFYEASEGGAGVLRRLLDEPGDLAKVARLALELAHFQVEPDGTIVNLETEEAGGFCVAACYDCLLSYYNQMDHQQIDRSLLPDLLRPWLSGKVMASVNEHMAIDPFGDLLAKGGTDRARAWLRQIRAWGCHLPDKAGEPIAGTKPDYLYSEANQQVAVFIDDEPIPKETEETLVDLGWTVVHFAEKATWPQILKLYSSCFGKAEIVRPPAADSLG